MPQNLENADSPPRYGAAFPGKGAFEAARARVLQVPHVADLTPCRSHEAAVAGLAAGSG